MTKREKKYLTLIKLRKLKLRFVSIRDYESAACVRQKERVLLGIDNPMPPKSVSNILKNPTGRVLDLSGLRKHWELHKGLASNIEDLINKVMSI